MSKFASNVKNKRNNRGVLNVSDVKTRTYEGGEAFGLDTKSELFTLGVTNMVSEDTFYESGKDRDSRFVELVHKVTNADPAWMQRFIPWLRQGAYMRSASVVAVAEYVAAGGPDGRKLVSDTLSRADEPAELVAYWFSRYGRNLPAAIKRGVADSVNELTNQYTAQKYAGESNDVSLADVIQLTHPSPQDEVQDALYGYVLDKYYQGNDADVPAKLTRLVESRNVHEQLLAEGLDAFLSRDDAFERLGNAGWTWERLGTYGELDADAWEAIIPSMGYMALLRNLRNFEQAGISKEAREYVRNKLRDPEEVARSRQLPFRFLSADKHVNSRLWGRALEDALNHSVSNVPELDGETLVLADVSGSMSWSRVSGNSTVSPADIAGLFAAAFAARNARTTDLVAFATNSRRVDVPVASSVLDTARKVNAQGLGGGTNMDDAINKHYAGHDRIIILTDMQKFPGRSRHDADFVHVFDLQGYGKSNIDTSKSGRFLYAGWTDQYMKNLPLLEKGAKGDWPF